MMIAHLIRNDKFTKRQIQFFQQYMKDYEHVFFVTKGTGKEDFSDLEHVTVLNKDLDLLKRAEYRALLQKADKIILSGLFSIRWTAAMFPGAWWKKTMIQFWGADLYSLEHARSVKHKLRRWAQKVCIQKSYGVINLVPGDYELVCRMFGDKERHFLAPIVNTEFMKNDYRQLNPAKRDERVRIVLGNSATATNHHVDMLEYLARFKDQGIEVICPLSYGEEAYRQKVLDAGRKMLGDAFHPLLEFMSMQDYAQLLAACDVGIFNNDRQQGMGNITIMLSMGKKVYLRDQTSMFRHFEAQGYKVYRIGDLEAQNLEQLAMMSEENRKNNFAIADPVQRMERIQAKWKRVLDA